MVKIYSYKEFTLLTSILETHLLGKPTIKAKDLFDLLNGSLVEHDGIIYVADIDFYTENDLVKITVNLNMRKEVENIDLSNCTQTFENYTLHINMNKPIIEQYKLD